MRRWTLVSMVWCVFVMNGCSGEQASEYDPDWDQDGPIEEGKADGIIDLAPELGFGDSAEGDVGGQRMELFVVELRRTDRIAIEMEVLTGDLNPHISLFWGTSSYIHSDDWSRNGNVLRKEYTVEDAGRYTIAARAYREEGEGTYRITVTCLGGPCNGEFPPPESELTIGDVASCVSQARQCSFARVLRYDGRVGEARAAELFNECLNEATLEDGGSCEAACAWQGDNEDATYDDASALCNDVTTSLIFYADQSQACLDLVDRCMYECYDAASYGYGYDWAEDLWETTEALCWADGFNGTCDGFARDHELCGGHLRADSAGECVEFCHSTTGAHIDDLDTLCGYDSDCEDYCDVDMAAASEACGGITPENEDCLFDFLDEGYAWICEDILTEALDAA